MVNYWHPAFGFLSIFLLLSNGQFRFFSLLCCPFFFILVTNCFFIAPYASLPIRLKLTTEPRRSSLCFSLPMLCLVCMFALFWEPRKKKIRLEILKLLARRRKKIKRRSRFRRRCNIREHREIIALWMNGGNVICTMNGVITNTYLRFGRFLLWLILKVGNFSIF
jgi:hypothetical protein